MSFTSTIHYVVLLISNKNLPLKKNAAPYRRNEDRPQRPSNQHHHHPNHLQPLFHLTNKLVMTSRSTFYSSTLMETDRTRRSIREKQYQTGGYTGVKALVKIQEPLHPEIHHST